MVRVHILFCVYEVGLTRRKPVQVLCAEPLNLLLVLAGHHVVCGKLGAISSKVGDRERVV